MNKKNKKLEIEKNRRKYKVPNMQSYCYRAKNAIFFGSGGIKHELAKFIGAIMLNKYGDIKFDEGLIVALKQLSGEIERVMKEFTKQKADFITEAEDKRFKGRIIDLVKLEDETPFEFESKKSIKKENATTFYI